jgi:Domain of unknown function (DUF5916)
MLLLLLVSLQSAGIDHGVYNGRAGDLAVQPPRISAVATIDGVLDEPAWERAAVLTGFSQYIPVDGLPASDSTNVLVWYAPHGIYFGIRAFEAHGGALNATLADRDRIDTDDYVQILLDTFNDRRRALVFGVNPLGVQADGIRSEGDMGAAGGPGAGGRFENVDLNPDFVFQSRGRVTATGYEVEMFVPFKSLRYKPDETQTWALNIIRKVQHSGYQDTWVPARRANASFLAQSGTLTGLTGLQRGLVLDLNPFTTGKATGRPGPDGWDYTVVPELGGNTRWGVTPNLTLNATANPDFSQVEADVGQVTINERFSLFFPEKRPFFLEGIELFDTPNQLIYMRRIRNPLGGVKLTGKVAGTSIGVLSALDDRGSSAGEDRYPIFNIVRLRRDLGENSTLGATYTGRGDGAGYNRVAEADARIVFGRMYTASAQLAGSFSRNDETYTSGPLWQLSIDRTGRNWGFRYSLKGVHPDFRAASGFVPRTGVVEPLFANRITAYGRPGATLENWTAHVMTTGVWDYATFFDGGRPLETAARIRNFFTLRGGWQLGATPVWETVEFDPDFYSRYAVEQVTPSGTDTTTFSVPGRINDVFGMGVSLSTPQFPTFAAQLNAQVGKAVTYFEPARGNRVSVGGTLTWRPTGQIRAELRYTHARLTRERDGSRLSMANIPRLKIEYQISRPLFIRIVTQYNAQTRDALRDPRSEAPILIMDAATGAYVRSTAVTTNNLRVDWLFSYRPTPGTVVFAGYGSSLSEPNAFSFRDVRRVSDGFFVKFSYLFRL